MQTLKDFLPFIVFMYAVGKDIYHWYKAKKEKEKKARKKAVS